MKKKKREGESTTKHKPRMGESSAKRKTRNAKLKIS